MSLPTPVAVFDELIPTKEILVGSTLSAFKALVDDSTAAPEQFLALLSAHNILAIGVAVGDVPTEMPKFIWSAIKPLRDLLFKEVPRLRTSESFQKALAAVAATQNKANEVQGEDALRPRSIAAIAAVPFLAGVEPLMPTVRILLQSSPPGANYEFFASAEELAQLATMFMGNLAQMLEQRASLASKGIVKLSAPVHAAKALGELENFLKRVKQLAPVFGIALNGPSESTASSDIAK